MKDERNGGTGDGGDGNGFDRSEDETKVEHALERTPTQLELARADGAAFDGIASGLDAFGASLGALPETLARLSRPRRSRLLWAVILKLGEVSELIHDARHELTEMKRAEDAQKDEAP